MAYEVSNGLKKHHGALIEYLERLENQFSIFNQCRESNHEGYMGFDP